MNAERPTYFRTHARLQGFDYRENVAYFVTVVTGNRLCVFGDVMDGAVRLSRRGLVVQACWNDIPVHHPHVDLDAFVIMPNHVHAIITIAGVVPLAPTRIPVAATPASPRAHGPAGGSLSAIVGTFKSAVSREINRLRRGAATRLWQPNFHDHVIRHDRAFDRIREYIESNPKRWSDDQENPHGTGKDDLAAFCQGLGVPNQPREATQASRLQGDADA